MGAFRDLFVLVLVGFYLLMAWSSQAASLPLKTSEEWAVTLGHHIQESMTVAKGKFKSKDTWFIEYRVGKKIVGRKLLLPEYYDRFKQEIETHLQMKATKTLAGTMSCPSPVLVHHKRSRGKVTKKEICLPLLSKENRLRFGQWFGRWRNLANRSQVF